MNVPDTRYAETALGRIAYQVVGDGPLNILVVSQPYIPIDLMWDEPLLVRFLNRLASFSRQIWFDPRGRGSSGPVPEAEGRLVESIQDDIMALLDNLGFERVTVLDLAGYLGLPFAAAHPERTSALVIYQPIARFRKDRNYAQGLADDDIERRLAGQLRLWGTGGQLRFLAPSLANDARLVRWLARSERLSSNPEEFVGRLRALYEVDLRHVLQAIQIPTLVVVRSGHRTTDLSRYVAEHIEGARMVEVPGEDLLFFAPSSAPFLDAVEEFLTGRLPIHEVDRVLATMVFTDLVGSTEQAARLGDRRWKELLATHDTLVRSELERFRGSEVKSMGDGFLATFDGPGRAVGFASAIRDAVSSIGLELRVGVHTGEIEPRGDDVGGLGVHIAQRVQSRAKPGEVLVSRTVVDLVAGSEIEFEDRGEHNLKGVPGSWRLFVVRGS